VEAARAAWQKVPPDPLPDRPWALEYLWDWFWLLSRTRQNGMDVNPISYQEIKAFSEQMGLGIDPWETRILRRMDDAALEARAGDRKAAVPSQPTTSDNRPMIPMSDVKGVRGLLRGLAVKKDVQAQQGLLGKRGKGGKDG